MPQIHNLPSRIPEGNYREAALLNEGLMENVFETRQRLIKRNERATQIKRMMEKSPELFGKGGAQLDTFGNEDIDLNKLKDVDNSRLQGPSTQSITNEVVNPLENLLQFKNSQNTNGAIDNIYAKQAEILGKPNPTYNNSSIPGTTSLLGSPTLNSLNPLPNNNQQAIIDQGLRNQQQLLGQTPPPPLGTGTVLKPDNGLPLQGGTTMQNNQFPLSASTSSKNSTNKGASTGHSENYTMAAKDNGFSHEAGLLTTKTSENRTNLIDPVKKDIDQLRTMAALYGTTFGGEVQDKNNPYAGMLKDKVDYMGALNEAMSKEGTTVEQSIEKLKTDDKGRDASLTVGYRDNSSVNFGEMNFGNSNIREAGGGSNTDKKITGIFETKGGGKLRYIENPDGTITPESGKFVRGYSSEFSVEAPTGTGAMKTLTEAIKNEFGDYYEVDTEKYLIREKGTGRIPFYFKPVYDGKKWKIDYLPNQGQVTHGNMLDFRLNSIQRINNSSSNLDQLTTTDEMILKANKYGANK